MENELITVSQLKPYEVFTNGGIDPILEEIRKRASAQIEGYKPDTSEGRKSIASVAYKVSQSKTLLDDLGKQLVTDWKQKSKAVDSERKKARDYLDDLKSQIRKPVTEYEEAEKNRKKDHEESIDFMNVLRGSEDMNFWELDSGELERRLDWLNAIDRDWEEYASEAERAKTRASEILTDAIEKRKKYESEQAELERLKQAEAERKQKEREEQIAKEAAERAEREAAEKAKQAEQEHIAAIERAEIKREQAVKEAEEKARKEAEQKEALRLAKEKDEKEAAERIARNKKHQAKINREILAAFMDNGYDERVGKTIIELVAKGKIPHMAINY